MTSPKRFLLPSLALLSLPALSQSTLTKIDIDPTIIANHSAPTAPYNELHPSISSEMVELAGEWYFTARTEATGYELFKTDGTAAGTKLVADVFVGPDSSQISSFAAVGGRVYFAAHTPAEGLELWSTQGTQATTSLVASIYPGSAGAEPRGLTVVGSKLYFSARSPQAGEEFFVLDTATTGLPVAIDIVPGSSDSKPANLVANPLGGGIFFEADDSLHGRRIWRSDGTLAGTSLVAPSAGLTGFEQPVAFGAGVLFLSSTPATGSEIHYTDGSAAGTILLSDIRPGSATSFTTLSPAGAVGSSFYFAATDPAFGRELYVTDGTAAGTHIVDDAVPGPGSSSPVPLGTVGGKLLINAILDPVQTGHELYTIGATGLELVLDLAPGKIQTPTIDAVLSSNPTEARIVGSDLLFGATDGKGTSALWATDGTSGGTHKLKTMDNVGVLTPDSITPISTTAAIFRGSSSVVGAELFRTDKTAAGTVVLADLEPGNVPFGSAPHSLVTMNGSELFFRAGSYSATPKMHRWNAGAANVVSEITFFDPIHQAWMGDHSLLLFSGSEIAGLGLQPGLYKTDGTQAGTSAVVKFVSTGIHGDLVLASDNTRTFVAGMDPANGQELWTSDGTAAGTTLVTDLNPGSGSSRPREATLFQGDLFFAADDGVHQGALFKSDGTAQGTSLVMDMSPFGDAQISNLTVVGSLLFFTATDGKLGVELWATDGTSAGTSMVRDIHVGAWTSDPVGLIEWNGLLYFFARKAQVSKRDIWVSDGTAAGTKVAAVVGEKHSPDAVFVEAGGRLFFQGSTTSQGAELWSFDGVSASMAADLSPGSSNGGAQSITACGDRVYFAATSPATGTELFVSDGTALGTLLVADVNPGSISSSPEQMTLCDGDLFFTATGADTDRELYRLTSPGAHVVDLGLATSGTKLSATTPVVGGSMTVKVEGTSTGNIGVLLLSGGSGASSQFMQMGSASWIDSSSFQLLGSSLASDWSVTTAIPASPAFVGAQFNLQAWFLAPGLFPATTSNGLRLVLGS